MSERLEVGLQRPPSWRISALPVSTVAWEVGISRAKSGCHLPNTVGSSVA